MARYSRHYGRSGYWVRESRRQEKRANIALTCIAVLLAVWAIGSSNKDMSQQPQTAQVQPALIAPIPPMEQSQVDPSQQQERSTVPNPSEVVVEEPQTPEPERAEEILTESASDRATSGLSCEHDPGTAPGILNLPGHPKDGQPVCARPADVHISQWL